MVFGHLHVFFEEMSIFLVGLFFLFFFGIELHELFVNELFVILVNLNISYAKKTFFFFGHPTLSLLRGAV